LAVHEPPLGLPFVDDRFYVARPWIEWLILARTNFVDIEEDVDAIEVEILQIAINTANIATNVTNIATNTANIATNTTDIATNTASILSNEALAYHFSSL
jgi:hypothetical protein